MKDFTSTLFTIHNICRHLLFYHDEGELISHSLCLLTAPFALGFDRACYLCYKKEMEVLKVEHAVNFYAKEAKILPLPEARVLHAKRKHLFSPSFDEAMKEYLKEKEDAFEEEARRALSLSSIYMEEGPFLQTLLLRRPTHFKEEEKVPKFLYKEEFLLFPLIKEEDVQGFFYIDNAYTQREISQTHIIEVTLFADFVNACMENIALHKRAQSETKQLLMIERISRRIAFAKTIEEIVNIIMKELKEVISFDIGSLIHGDGEEGIGYLFCTKGIGEDVVRGMKELIEKKLRPFLAYNIRFEEKFLEPFLILSGPKAERILSHIYSPLAKEEEIKGFLILCSTTHYFEKQDTFTLSTICSQIVQAMENIRLHKEQHEAYIQIIASLVAAIEKKDPYTHGHSEKVAEYSVKIAEAMGLPQDMIQRVRDAGLLHDIGKIGIKDEILLKKGTLSWREYEEIKKHPEFGVSILEKLPFLLPILPTILHHHERWDGSGYPKGMKKEEIPLEARIIAVADAFEAMISERSYRKALKEEEALHIIERCKGRFFDPEVVDAFLKLFKRKRLDNGEDT